MEKEGFALSSFLNCECLWHAVCLITAMVGMRCHWSRYWLPTCIGRLRRDGLCCGREAQCGRLT